MEPSSHIPVLCLLVSKRLSVHLRFLHKAFTLDVFSELNLKVMMLRILEHTLVKNKYFFLVYSQFKIGYLLTQGWNCNLNFEKQLRENNLGFIEFIFILIKND